MVGGHVPDCVYERCWAERTAKPAPLDDRIQLTGAEFLAAIDRAFNAGVHAERARVGVQRRLVALTRGQHLPCASICQLRLT